MNSWLRTWAPSWCRINKLEFIVHLFVGRGYIPADHLPMIMEWIAVVNASFFAKNERVYNRNGIGGVVLRAANQKYL